jgi:hypothetical protein
VVDGILLEPLGMSEVRLDLSRHRLQLLQLPLRLRPLLRLLLRLLHEPVLLLAKSVDLLLEFSRLSIRTLPTLKRERMRNRRMPLPLTCSTVRGQSRCLAWCGAMYRGQETMVC